MYDEVSTINNIENVKKLTQLCQSVISKKYDFNREVDYTKCLDDIRETCLEYGYKTENLRIECNIVKLDLVPVIPKVVLLFDTKEENNAEVN